jgi:hypothetical protein
MPTKTTRTLSVLCPFCLNSEATVRLDLNDLAECVCSECDETFSPAAAVAKFDHLAERWRAVAAWVDTAPTV